MTDPIETNYDATRDPRTGRPPLPIDVENARQAANSASETQTAEENEGIAFDEKDIADEEPDTATSVEGQGGEEVQETDQTGETAGEELNSTVARMRAPNANQDDTTDVDFETLKEENEKLKRLLGEAVLENENTKQSFTESR